MGGTYEFVKTASANLREKDDSWNTALGGFFAGSVMGLKGTLSNIRIEVGARAQLTMTQCGRCQQY